MARTAAARCAQDAAAAASPTHRFAAGNRSDEELTDDYDEYDDERPTLDPVERPTEARAERPMRHATGSRMGPSRNRSR